MRAITLFSFLAACSSPEKPPAMTSPGPSPSPSPSSPRVDALPPIAEVAQLRATVRIDPEPMGKRFQGVWLELADKQRFVISYRAHDYWKPFEGREVVVTGHCYQPGGQAISGQHFHVDTMRFLDPKRGQGPILEVGPEKRMHGKLVKVAAPAGSKAEGTTTTKFVEEDGTAHEIYGSSDRRGTAVGDAVWIKARPIVPDVSWTAQTGGPKIWIIDVVPARLEEKDVYGPMDDVPEKCPAIQ